METRTAIIKGKRIVNRQIIVPFVIGTCPWYYPTDNQEEVCEFILDNNVVIEVTRDEYDKFRIGDTYSYQEDTEFAKFFWISLGALFTVILTAIFLSVR